MSIANSIAALLKEAFQIVAAEEGDPSGTALTCALKAYDLQVAANLPPDDLEQLVALLRGVQRSDREIAVGTDPDGMFQKAKVGAVAAIAILRQQISDKMRTPL